MDSEFYVIACVALSEHSVQVYLLVSITLNSICSSMSYRNDIK